MDFSQFVLLGFVIAGINQLMAHLRALDFWGAATIALAAATGLLFGFFGVEGLTPWVGLAAGFGTAGGVTLAGKLSGSPTASVTPNTTVTNNGK
jgi:hypothetical protein